MEEFGEVLVAGGLRVDAAGDNLEGDFFLIDFFAAVKMTFLLQSVELDFLYKKKIVRKGE